MRKIIIIALLLVLHVVGSSQNTFNQPRAIGGDKTTNNIPGQLTFGPMGSFVLPLVDTLHEYAQYKGSVTYRSVGDDNQPYIANGLFWEPLYRIIYAGEGLYFEGDTIKMLHPVLPFTGLVYEPTVVIVDSSVSVLPDIVWQRLGVPNLQSFSSSFAIPLEPVGSHRIDAIFIDSTDVIDIVSGQSSLLYGIPPTIPDKGILIRYINIDGTSISEGDNGSAFVDNIYVSADSLWLHTHYNSGRHDSINWTGGSSGGSQTWQQTLITGSNLTQDNNIHGGNFNFYLDSIGSFDLSTGDFGSDFSELFLNTGDGGFQAKIGSLIGNFDLGAGYQRTEVVSATAEKRLFVDADTLTIQDIDPVSHTAILSTITFPKYPSISGRHISPLTVNGTAADATGNITLPGISGLTGANNGLTNTGGVIGLGGTLLGNTTITNNSGYSLHLNSANQTDYYTGTLSLDGEFTNNPFYISTHASISGSASVNFEPITLYGYWLGTPNVGESIRNFYTQSIVFASATTDNGDYAGGTLAPNGRYASYFNTIESKVINANFATKTSEFRVKGTGAGTFHDLLLLRGNGVVNIAQGAQNFANNAAAITGGLVAGDIYRNGDVLMIVH